MDGSGYRLAPEDSLAILSLYRKSTVLIGKFCDTNLVRKPLTGLQDHDATPPNRSCVVSTKHSGAMKSTVGFLVRVMRLLLPQIWPYMKRTLQLPF